MGGYWQVDYYRAHGIPFQQSLVGQFEWSDTDLSFPKTLTKVTILSV